MPIPTADTVRAELIFNYGTVVLENVLHFTTELVSWGTANMEDLGAALYNWANIEYLGWMSDDIQLAEILLTSLDPAHAFQINATGDYPVIGGTVDPILPSNVNAVVKFLTGNIGRSFRGRAYVPGLGESFVVGNALDTAKAGQLLNVWEELPDILNAEAPDWFHTVVSFYTAGAPRANGVATPVTTYAVDGLVKTQRRRLT